MIPRSRFGWIAAVLLLAALGRQVKAGNGDALDFKYMYYWDRNGVKNHSPVLHFVKSVSNYLKLSWQQEFDAVSGASRRLGLRNTGRQGDNTLALDGLTGASRREWRHSEKAGVAYARGHRTANVTLYHSAEDDYTSYSPAVAGSWGFNARSTSLGGEVSAFFDNLHPRGPFTGQGGDRRIVSLSLSLTQALTPLSLISFSVNSVFSQGDLGHPYNPVILADGAMLLESLPDTRSGLVLTGLMVQGYKLAGRLGSARLEGRYYRDTWELASQTLDAQVYQYVRGSAYLRLRARAYQQQAAGFAKAGYVGNEVYRTADIRYFGFSSLLAGVKAGADFPESWGQGVLKPDRWDISYEQGLRNTRGQGGAGSPYYQYQLFSRDEYYLQGTFMLGLGFDF